MGKALLTFCFPLKNILRRKIHWEEVRFPNYTTTRNPLHSIYFPSDHCRLENTVKFIVFKTPFRFLRWYLDYVYYKKCCGRSPIPSEASNRSPGSPSLPTSAPASPQSSSAAPPGRPGEWHCKTQGSQTARKITLTSQVNKQQLREETLEQRETEKKKKKTPKVIFRKSHQSSWGNSGTPSCQYKELGRSPSSEKKIWSEVVARACAREEVYFFFSSDAEPSSWSKSWLSDNVAWWHFLIGFPWHPRVASTPGQKSQGHNNSRGVSDPQTTSPPESWQSASTCDLVPRLRETHGGTLHQVYWGSFPEIRLEGVVEKIHSGSTGITQE